MEFSVIFKAPNNYTTITWPSHWFHSSEKPIMNFFPHHMLSSIECLLFLVNVSAGQWKPLVKIIYTTKQSGSHKVESHGAGQAYNKTSPFIQFRIRVALVLWFIWPCKIQAGIQDNILNYVKFFFVFWNNKNAFSIGQILWYIHQT